MSQTIPKMRDSYTEGQTTTTDANNNGVTTTTYHTTTNYQPATTSYTTSNYQPGISTVTNIIGGQPGSYRTSQVVTGNSRFQSRGGSMVYGTNVRTGTPTKQSGVYTTTTTTNVQPVTTTTQHTTYTSGWQQVGGGATVTRTSQIGTTG